MGEAVTSYYFVIGLCFHAIRETACDRGRFWGDNCSRNRTSDHDQSNPKALKCIDDESFHERESKLIQKFNMDSRLSASCNTYDSTDPEAESGYIRQSADRYPSII